jgi:hypothetical protein
MYYLLYSSIYLDFKRIFLRLLLSLCLFILARRFFNVELIFQMLSMIPLFRRRDDETMEDHHMVDAADMGVVILELFAFASELLLLHVAPTLVEYGDVDCNRRAMRELLWNRRAAENMLLDNTVQYNIILSNIYSSTPVLSIMMMCLQGTVLYVMMYCCTVVPNCRSFYGFNQLINSLYCGVIEDQRQYRRVRA